ncbi:UNC93-like protein isoform X2 [Temnothorax nylanderi]|uniref:UNC93-like protein isoform X2 n=1 Tax=Temnothorax nylanderi TaxID=102681 RepID=UPI003A8B9247
MGSLPNLHELSKDKLGSPVYKPAPIGGLGPKRLPAQPPPLAHTHKRARSSGHHHSILSDNDAMLEHMAAYSPISCRSTRTSALSWRRRDSMNSSAGASSVRRLIAAVRAAPSGPRPPRRVVLRHIAALLLGHASCSAATLPIFPLQAGLGAFEPRMGPVLLAYLYMMAAATSCFAPIVVQRLGTNLTITASHVVTAIFVGVHMYPKWYILVPSYVMLGCCASPSFLARTSHINVSATSLALVCVDSPEDPDETRRECLLRRLNRGIKLAEDIGLAIGCLIAAILVRLTDLTPSSDSSVMNNDVCGAEYCSEDMYFYNESLYVPTITPGTSRVLVSIWLGLAVLGLGISCAFLDSRVQEPQANHDRASVKDILKSVKSAFQDPKLQLAAPLTLFIGLEQGFIYADFMEAYVVCALGGVGTVTLSFLSLALLQALAAATLSMLLRHIKRYFVVVVGFAFHACLLLVLVTWRPTGDDPALFHVISAAWGVCNSIWETLIYTLVIGLYPNAWQGPLATSLFWRWLGLTFALSLHGAVCTRYRVLGLAVTLVLAVVPYLWLESRIARRGKTLAPL